MAFSFELTLTGSYSSPDFRTRLSKELGLEVFQGFVYPAQ